MQEGNKGRMPYSWFYFDLVKNVSKDKTFHSCQLPSKMIQMLIQSCTNEGDCVFILFGGSGNEILLCENLKRKWISAELHKPYYDMILERLKNGGKIEDKYRLSGFERGKRVKKITQDNINDRENTLFKETF